MTTLEKELIEALRGVVWCFDEHLAQEAYDNNVKVENLCPCWTGARQTARDLLAKIDDN